MKPNLLRHFKAKHEGVKYVCSECDYKASYNENLLRHYKAKHEGVKYYCSQCDFRASIKDSLSRHFKAKHEGVKYVCSKCDYRASIKENLRRHFKAKHEPHNQIPPDDCNFRDSGLMLPCTNELVADMESSSDDVKKDLPCSPVKKSQEAKSDID